MAVCWLATLPFSSVIASQEAAYKNNEEGLIKLRARDYEGAIESLKKAHRYEPASEAIKKNLGVAYNNYGFDLMSKGDSDAAIEKYQYSLSYDPENAYTLYNLGQAYYRKQDMARAKDYLNKAHQRDPSLPGAAALLEKITAEEATERAFDTFETAHFVIAASGGVAAGDFSLIKIYLEEAYGRIGKLLNHYPRRRTAVVLYSEEDYQQLLGGRPHWTMAIFDGKVRIPVNKLKYNKDDVIKIIYHEYTHVVIHDSAGDAPVPLWLNEGTASWMEDFVAPKNRDFMRSYIEKYGFVPFASIPNDFTNINDPEIATLMYIESYLLVDYIIAREGDKGLQKILKSISAGNDVSLALLSVFKEGPEEFQKKWEQFIINSYNIKKLKYQ